MEVRSTKPFLDHSVPGYVLTFPNPVSETFGPWTWIDPGAFALVGAGAFMGGVTRLTLALAVIMIEVSSDVHMLLPVLVAVMTVGSPGLRPIEGSILTKILFECRDDLNWPWHVSQAKWVADSVTHSLYHGLLEVKCVPFLPPEPVSKYSLDLVPVSFVMRSPVVTLKEKMKVREMNGSAMSC